MEGEDNHHTDREEVDERRRRILEATAGIAGLSAVGAENVAAEESERKESTRKLKDSHTTSDDVVQAISAGGFFDNVTSTGFTGASVQHELFSDSLQGFPLAGNQFAVLSSGRAADAPGNAEKFASSSVGGESISNGSPDGFDTFDVGTLTFKFTVPDGAGKFGFDYKFGTEENPTYLDSPFRDFFTATVTKPDGSTENIAKLPNDNPVTVDNANQFANSPGGSSSDPSPPFPDPDDTVYNSVTELLTAELDVSSFQGEELTIELRIGDASDPVLDSAVFIDSIGFGQIDLDLRNVRLIQINENTIIDDPNINPEISDPDLVSDKQTTVAFDLDGDTDVLNELPESGLPFKIVLEHDDGTAEPVGVNGDSIFHLEKKWVDDVINKGLIETAEVATVSGDLKKIFVNSNLPTFAASPDIKKVILEMAPDSSKIDGDSQSKKQDTDFTIRTTAGLSELDIGFTQLRIKAIIPAEQPGGTASIKSISPLAYPELVKDIIGYVSRAYPVRHRVNAYVHSPIVHGPVVKSSESDPDYPDDFEVISNGSFDSNMNDSRDALETVLDNR